MNIHLNAFPTPLLRLILCGGKGLAPAWGPLAKDKQVRWMWDPWRQFVQMYDDSPVGITYWREYPAHAPESWSIPFDDASPWPDRLAMVAAYLTWLDTSPKVLLNPPEFDMLAASIDLVFDEWEKGRVVALTRLAHRGPLPSVHTWKWSAKTGFCWGNGPRLTTLPEHLHTHPTVAMLLALYDVPEIRARVESA